MRVRASVRRAGLLLALVVALLAGLGLWLPSRIEGYVNRRIAVRLPEPSERARRLHAASAVVDLHADTLLWGRDPLRRSALGHVDVPRLREGGVALEFFTIVTRVPIGAVVDRADGDDLDAVTLLALLERWPSAALRSPFERALHQARQLGDAVERADGRLHPMLERRDVDRLLALRRRDPQVVGALLGVEGAHALEGDPTRLAPLFEAGVRMVGLAHLFDNAFAGSAQGLEKGGLTEAGRRLVGEMQRRGVIVDLAHASARTIDDVLALGVRAPVVSHTGVRATCDNNRNLSDDQIDRIAAAGGVIGIGFWPTAVCGAEPVHVARALRHVVERVGDRHAALGSDWDGATAVGFDATGLVALTQALLDEGLPERSIRRILGENALRVLRATLPVRPR